MKLIEYRIFLPLTVDENQVGQLWSFAEVSRLNTGGGEGVEILQNEFFRTPRDPETNRILLKNLPEFEDYESQQTSGGNKFKKSASKENFSAKRGSLIVAAERSKSLENVDESSVSHNLPASTQLIKHMPENEDKSKYGQYTHKLYRVASKVPWFVRKIVPKDSLIMKEKCWNIYPQVKTVVTNQYFRSNFRLELDTITRECVDCEAEFNVHNLTPEQLDKREIVVVDISEPSTFGQYKEEEDPTLFKSQKTGRGPLVRGEWMKTQKPMICVYKLLLIEFKVFGLQTRFENYFKNAYKQMFLTFHRQIFCWIDNWIELTLDDVRKIEEDLAKLLVEKIKQGEISKQCLNSIE